jgi:catechol 2,3-dioxygenase-like lactoylglutathione lyase family enzyme
MDTVSVRYIVDDADAAIAFYTRHLGFTLDMHPAPGFARLSRGALRLLLNEPGAGGAGQSMPDGSVPAAGGWNRIQLTFEDLSATAARLQQSGVRFRSGLIEGKGGKQIVIEDPSGNPIELFQP